MALTTTPSHHLTNLTVTRRILAQISVPPPRLVARL